MKLFSLPKVGLALGGGGAKGLTHIGVIKVLEKNKIPLDYISGTSIGSLIGGLYAATKDIKLIEQIVLDNNWREIGNLFFDPTFKLGFVQGEKIKKFIEKYIGDIDFKDLKIPFAVTGTDLKTGNLVVINSGKVAEAIRISISIPILFKPVEKNGQILVDGGLSSPVPVEVVKKMGAQFIIGVDLYNDYSDRKIRLTNIPYDSVNILIHNLGKKDTELADITISPKTSTLGWSKFLSQKGSLEGIRFGEEATKKIIPKLKVLLAQKRTTTFFTRLVNFFKKRFNPNFNNHP